MRFVAERRELQWEEIVEEFRKNYYGSLQDLVPALIATDDALIVYNCVRFADLSQPQEVQILQEFAKNCDIEKHQVSLQALVEAAEADFAPILRERGKAKTRKEWEEQLGPTVTATLFKSRR
jgi:hypothetical protein